MLVAGCWSPFAKQSVEARPRGTRSHGLRQHIFVVFGGRPSVRRARGGCVADAQTVSTSLCHL